METRYLVKKKHTNLLILLCWLAYSLATFSRLTYNVSIVDVMGHFGVDKTQTGLVASCFSLCYGIGQLINGWLTGKIAPRKMIFLGLVGSAVSNIIMPFVPFGVYKYSWAFNGLIQSVLWCNIMQTFADMLDKKALPGAIVVVGTTTAAGTFLAYGASALCVAVSTWQTVFYIATILLVVMAAAWYVLTKKLTGIQATCPIVRVEQTEDEPKAHQGTSWIKMLSYSSGILFIACFACNFSTPAYNDWAVPVLDDVFPWLGNSVAKTITMVVPLIAILGSFLARWLFAKFKNPFKSYVLIYGALFALAFLMSVVFRDNVVVTVAIFVLIALGLTAINNTCTSIVPLNMRRYGKSGGIAGIVNGCCHLGETVGATLLAATATASGWSAMFVLVGTVSAVVAVLSVVGAIYWKKHVAQDIDLG